MALCPLHCESSLPAPTELGSDVGFQLVITLYLDTTSHAHGRGGREGGSGNIRYMKKSVYIVGITSKTVKTRMWSTEIQSFRPQSSEAVNWLYCRFNNHSHYELSYLWVAHTVSGRGAQKKSDSRIMWEDVWTLPKKPRFSAKNVKQYVRHECNTAHTSKTPYLQWSMVAWHHAVKLL